MSPSMKCTLTIGLSNSILFLRPAALKQFIPEVELPNSIMSVPKMSNNIESIREAKKKCQSFCSGPATKALPPPPRA